MGEKISISSDLEKVSHSGTGPGGGLARNIFIIKLLGVGMPIVFYSSFANEN